VSTILDALRRAQGSDGGEGQAARPAGSQPEQPPGATSTAPSPDVKEPRRARFGQLSAMAAKLPAAAGSRRRLAVFVAGGFAVLVLAFWATSEPEPEPIELPAKVTAKIAAKEAVSKAAARPANGVEPGAAKQTAPAAKAVPPGAGVAKPSAAAESGVAKSVPIAPDAPTMAAAPTGAERVGAGAEGGVTRAGGKPTTTAKVGPKKNGPRKGEASGGAVAVPAAATPRPPSPTAPDSDAAPSPPEVALATGAAAAAAVAPTEPTERRSMSDDDEGTGTVGATVHVLDEPPDGAPELSLVFIRWKPTPSERVASVRTPGQRIVVVRETDVVEGMKVERIHSDAIEFQWRGQRFMVMASRY
jgi:hypothetical protein